MERYTYLTVNYSFKGSTTILLVTLHYIQSAKLVKITQLIQGNIK